MYWASTGKTQLITLSRNCSGGDIYLYFYCIFTPFTNNYYLLWHFTAVSLKHRWWESADLSNPHKILQTDFIWYDVLQKKLIKSAVFFCVIWNGVVGKELIKILCHFVWSLWVFLDQKLWDSIQLDTNDIAWKIIVFFSPLMVNNQIQYFPLGGFYWNLLLKVNFV